MAVLGSSWQGLAGHRARPSWLGPSQRDSVCSEVNDRSNAPRPGRLPVDSRGRCTGNRLRREPCFPRRDDDGHSAGRGLPAEAVCQPLLGEQACGRQDHQVAGGRGAGPASNTLRRRPGPRVLQGFPGTLVSEGALSSDACARLCSPGPSPACWKYGWIIIGTTFVSSQNFAP